MRLALLSARPELARGLYPDYFEAEEIVEDESGSVDLNREDVSYDFSKVEWESPSDMGDEEFEALQRLLANQNIIVQNPSEPPEGVKQNSRLDNEPVDPEWT